MRFGAGERSPQGAWSTYHFDPRGRVRAFAMRCAARLTRCNRAPAVRGTRRAIRTGMMRTILIVGLTTTAAVACAPMAIDSGPGDVTEGKQSSNGLQLSELTLRRLTAEPLSVQAPALAADAAGAELLDYAARCALGDGQRVSAGGRDYAGHLGLAPGWRDGACDASCRRWVSACLIAHGNVPGESVRIWLRADHPALGAAPSDAPFPYQEAAFYGDVFVPADQPLAMHACLGRDVFGGATDESIHVLQESLEEYLHHRMCTVQDTCGIEVAGFCHRDVEPRELTACDRDGGARGAYGACHTRSAGARDEGADDDVVFHEVITIYVED